MSKKTVAVKNTATTTAKATTAKVTKATTPATAPTTPATKSGPALVTTPTPATIPTTITPTITGPSPVSGPALVTTPATAPTTPRKPAKLDTIARLINRAALDANFGELKILAEQLAHRLSGNASRTPAGRDPETIRGKRLALIRVSLNGTTPEERASAKRLAVSLLDTLETPANRDIHNTEEASERVGRFVVAKTEQLATIATIAAPTTPATTTPATLPTGLALAEAKTV